jgi:hypothetical protein
MKNEGIGRRGFIKLFVLGGLGLLPEFSSLQLKQENPYQNELNNFIETLRSYVYAIYDYQIDNSTEKIRKIINLQRKVKRYNLGDYKATKEFFRERGLYWESQLDEKKEELTFFLGKILEGGKTTPPTIGKKQTLKYLICDEIIEPFLDYSSNGYYSKVAHLSSDKELTIINKTNSYNYFKNIVWEKKEQLIMNNKLIMRGKGDSVLQLLFKAYNPYFKKLKKESLESFFKLAFKDYKKRLFIHEAGHLNFGESEYYPRLLEIFFIPHLGYAVIYTLLKTKNDPEKKALEDLIQISGVKGYNFSSLTPEQLKMNAGKLIFQPNKDIF